MAGRLDLGDDGCKDWSELRILALIAIANKSKVAWLF